MNEHLSDDFLDRVRRAYRRAIAATSRTRGLWGAHDERRADVHAALIADDNDALRAIFNNPTITDLYYGVDNLCRSITRLSDPSEFVSQALSDSDHRARCAVYQIKRLRDLGPTVHSVVEIGRGMGRAAYYGHLAGMDYTTIDLPLGIVAQACFLGRVLSPDALWLAGENDVAPNGRIKLLYELPDRRFDAALNVDSITEMPASVAFRYFWWIAGHARSFFSINHEKNRFTVANVAAFSAPHRVFSRCLCPIWNGYTEETFLLSGTGMLPRGIRLAAFESFVLQGRIKRRVKRWLEVFRRSSSCS